SMPDWAQWISMANPFRYFMEAMRAIYLKGSTLADLTHQMAMLLAMAAVASTGAVLSYRKR
ncbi:MAG: ABC transporter permease, partial [Bacteroidaceae bacterium]|nr:ABC transporter permease [Bacteroidaceae bacterium]